MFYPARDKVQGLATQGNLLPVWREISADLDTPVSIYLKLRDKEPSFLLESVEKGEQVGRYSFLGVGPTAYVTAQNGEGSLWENGAVQRIDSPNGDPLEAMKSILSRYRPVPVEGLPTFCGGFVGYLGYDAVRFFEKVSLPEQSASDIPDAVFMLADSLVVYDHVKHRVLVIVNARLEGDALAAYDAATKKIDSIVDRLYDSSGGIGSEPEGEPVPVSEWTANWDQSSFENAIRSAKEYIAAGDLLQVVLSQRLSHRTEVDPFSIYRSLRMLNPSPYMFYLDLPGELRLIGASPEMLVRLTGREAEVRPIAGTRHRGETAEEDRRLAGELMDDPKERAEHVMLVDLGRNDLGRVCRYGSVSVPELMVIERFSHVMHIVSGVRGELRGDRDAFDLLRSAFPAGTVAGAPKVRAMEILSELEGERRGPYAGAVGYFSYSGDMDACIAIRTLVMEGNTVHVQAGAGIVADSEPAKEHQETLNKAQALAEAVRRAEAGEMVHVASSVQRTKGGMA